MSLLEEMRRRYSVRKLEKTPIEKEKLEAIVEAGRIAPTAANRQPYHLWLLESEQAMANLNKVCRFTFGAPVALVVGASEEEAWVRSCDNKNFADVDASIVATQIMLEIDAQGLGTTWVGYFEEGQLKEMYPEMSNYNLIAIFPIGYPSKDAEPSKSHTDRKNVEEVLTRL